MKNLLLVIIALTMFVSCIGQNKEMALQKKQMSAYLLVYFKDESHSLYFALSRDGYSFTDVNGGRPVISGDTIAEQKGVRDPYLYRGPDGMFYMAMTDLHIFAEKEGLRNTEWERDGKQFGWGNNRGMVLMKSPDLLNWSHSVVRVDKSFSGLDSIGCAWAPELIWDTNRKKMMIYFTMRFHNGQNRLYYAYLDNSLTKLETYPELLFKYPADLSYIDGDITRVGNKFHLMYVPHDKGGPGIKQAISDSLNKGYTYDSTWVDPEPKACEAPTVFKRIGQDKWVLIYDIYGIDPHNFGFSETTDFVKFKDLGHFNKGVMKATNFSSPKHGAVIHLTKKEAQRLANHWALNMKF